MKVVALFVLLFSFNVMAGTSGNVGNVPANALYGELVYADSLCPAGVVCFVGGSTLTFKFTFMNSCEGLDSLHYTFDENNQMLRVEAAGKDSHDPNIACAMYVREELHQLTLVNIFPTFEVVFAGYPQVGPVTVDVYGSYLGFPIMKNAVSK